MSSNSLNSLHDLSFTFYQFDIYRYFYMSVNQTDSYIPNSEFIFIKHHGIFPIINV